MRNDMYNAVYVYLSNFSDDERDIFAYDYPAKAIYLKDAVVEQCVCLINTITFLYTRKER